MHCICLLSNSFVESYTAHRRFQEIFKEFRFFFILLKQICPFKSDPYLADFCFLWFWVLVFFLFLLFSLFSVALLISDYVLITYPQKNSDKSVQMYRFIRFFLYNYYSKKKLNQSSRNINIMHMLRRKNK